MVAARFARIPANLNLCLIIQYDVFIRVIMALKVFDLQCDAHHVFEGWFSSHEDYDSQKERGLLSCPVCDSHHVSKMLSAPRLNVSHLKKEKQSASAVATQTPVPEKAVNIDEQQLAQVQAAVMQQLRTFVKQTEDVGDRFATEARRMHYGDAKERSIRGRASPQETRELQEEGIAVMPIPDFLDDNNLH